MGTVYSASRIIFIACSLLMVVTVFYRLYYYHHLKVGSEKRTLYRAIYDALLIYRFQNQITESALILVGTIITIADCWLLRHGGHLLAVEIGLMATLLLIASDEHLNSIANQYLLSTLQSCRKRGGER